MTISVEKAVLRVRKIVPMLTDDVRRALALHTAMETANEMLPTAMKGVHVLGAETYNLTQNALMLKLSMDAARIYDWTANRSVDEQEKASIPVLHALLAREDVRDFFLAEARQWTTYSQDAQVKACDAALGRIARAGEELQQPNSELEGALRRVRQFRTQRLAHMLFDKEPEQLPSYNDVFKLILAAKPVVKAARLAIEGSSTEPDWEIDQWRRSAEAHYGHLLAGMRADGH